MPFRKTYKFRIFYIRNGFLLFHLFDRVEEFGVLQDELDGLLGGLYDDFLIGGTELAIGNYALFSFKDQSIAVQIQF